MLYTNLSSRASNCFVVAEWRSGAGLRSAAQYSSRRARLYKNSSNNDSGNSNNTKKTNQSNNDNGNGNSNNMK